MSKTFRQYDSRWSRNNYNGSSNMATAGCGPTACADIIYNMDTKTNPWKVAKWMKENGYAIYGKGTAHNGIPAALKHFGCTKVAYQETMKDVFKVMKEGHAAILLFRAGSRNGKTFTTSGHFIAATDYKVEGGKHYLYLRDPGQRRNDGWICYEKYMLGLIYKAWTCYTTKINGEPRGITANQELIAKTAVKLAWKKGTSKSKYAYPKGRSNGAYRYALNKAYPNRSWSAPAKAGASCDVFVGTVMRTTGLCPKYHRGLSEQWDDLKKSCWKEIKPSKARRGDVVIYKRTDGGVHTCIVTGHNVAEASYGDFYPVIRNVKKSRLSKSGKKKLKVYRYIK